MNHSILSIFGFSNIMLINFNYILSILVLSLLVIFMSKNGYLGNYLKRFCVSQGLSEFIILILIFTGVFVLIIEISYSLINYFNLNIGFDYIYSKVTDGNVTEIKIKMDHGSTQDPVRWWPSGTAQSWGIIGSVLGVYRMMPGSPRIRALAAISTLGVTVPASVYALAVENPYGFNVLMHSAIQYTRTGEWPLLNKNSVVTDVQINKDISEVPELSKVVMDTVDKGANTLLPVDNNLFDLIFSNSVTQEILKIFRPVPVEGHLDDLIGQQIFITYLLLMIVLSLIVFFLFYVSINIINSNKEFLINKFSNKYIKLYIKYQFILTKISLILLPLLIMFGLIELLIGIHFLLTHLIPYEELGIDLHTYIKK